MMNLENTKIRMELVSRYLGAETTIDEERLLRQFYAQRGDAPTPEEHDVRLLVLSSENLAGEFTLSEEKAEEFDWMMKSKRTAIYWIVSVAAAVAVAFIMLTNRQMNENIGVKQTVIITPKETVIQEQQKPVEENQTIAVKPAKPRTIRKNKRKERGITEREVSDLIAAANYTDEQVEMYSLRPVGDATIVTKTLADGSDATYIVCPSDDNEGFHVVPINIDF